VSSEVESLPSKSKEYFSKELIARQDQLTCLKRLNLLVNWLGRKFQLYTGSVQGSCGA